MNILHVVHSLDASKGGPSRTVPQLVADLKLLDVKADILYQHKPNDSVLASCKPDVSLLPLSVKTHWLDLFGIPVFQFFLSSFFSRFKYDVIHIHGLWSFVSIWAMFFAFLKNIPFVVHPRGMLEPWCLNQKRIKKLIFSIVFQRFLFKSASFVVATSDSEVSSCKLYGASKIYLIPNGLPSHSYVSLISPSFRHTSKRRFLFLSRIHPKKGLEILLEAFHLNSHSEFELTIVGPGESSYIAFLHDLINRVNLTERIRIMGPVSDDEKWALYDSHDFVVLPSYSENFGLVVLEALARGKPVITSTGTPWSSLPKKKCGWYVSPDVVSFSKVLAEAMSMKEALYASFSINSLSYSKEYDSMSVARSLREAYLALPTRSKL